MYRSKKKKINLIMHCDGWAAHNMQWQNARDYIIVMHEYINIYIERGGGRKRRNEFYF